MPMQCIQCKGKGLCGLPRCPITSRFQAQIPLKPASSYQGTSPSVFIGSYGYPAVQGGPLLVNDGDHPPDWLARNLGIEDIVGIRARTIRGSATIDRFSGNLQEIALSTRPLDVDVNFERPVSFAMTFDGTVAPVGLTGMVRQMDVIGSATVDRIVDKVTSDVDVRATEACIELARGEIDVYQITKLMTAGLLGRRRKFVPTRWAITAVDDTLSTALKKEISRFPPLDEYRVFYGEIFGNRICCVIVPGDWRYEMIEIWGKHTLWAGDADVIVQDREGMKKTGYSPISGAYYSARLGVCEYLKSIRRSARVIVVRYVTNEYWAPLGTWVIREATRRAMAAPPVACLSLDEAIQQATIRLGFSHWQPASTLIPELRTQRTLF
ncbi:MAG: Nre family DNA repair protein [Methanoregula sp.]